MRCFILLLALAIGPKLHAQADSISEHFNYVIGTQTFGATYGFSNESRLLETARAIRSMGSDIIKFHLENGVDGIQSSPKYYDLDSLIHLEPSLQLIFDSLDFKHYFMWVRSYNDWYDGYSSAERQDDSLKIYNLSKYLLQKYANSGKNFFIGHWEGDWYLLPGFNINGNPSTAVIQNMRSWLQCRQNAIDQAKLDYPSPRVNVFHYAELNRVLDAYTGGKRRMVNEVIPYVNLDYVSYSAYDTQHFSDLGFSQVLDYIENQLPPKQVPSHRRVLIGEFGRPADAFNYQDSLHEAANREICRKALKWCSPYILYWQMYNNEIKNGKQKGFWLIDSAQRTTELYQTFKYFYPNAKNWVYNFALVNGRAPSDCEYSRWADSLLSQRVNSMVINRLSADEHLRAKALKLEVYPNPSTTGMFHLESQKPGFHYQVHNINGQVIHSAYCHFNKAEIQLKKKGLYLLQVHDGEGLYTIRLLW